VVLSDYNTKKTPAKGVSGVQSAFRAFKVLFEPSKDVLIVQKTFRAFEKAILTFKGRFYGSKVKIRHSGQMKSTNGVMTRFFKFLP